MGSVSYRTEHLCRRTCARLNALGECQSSCRPKGEPWYSLDVVDCPSRIGGVLILGGVSDKSLFIVEGDIGRGYSVSLIVDQNLDFAILHHTDTRIGGSQIDADN